METVSEQDKIYAAAMIDGGSYFSVKSGVKYSANIRLRRKSVVMLDEFQQKFGGYLGRTKNEYCLNFNGHQCTDLLVAVLPYLRVKQDQARILMEYNAHIRSEARGKKPGSRLSEAERDYRESLNARLLAYNQPSKG
jgi:hypothetical protein